MKQFVKALNYSNASILFIKTKFLKLSDSKFKEIIFVGTQIHTLFKHKEFETTFKTLEFNVWKKNFKVVCNDFLGKINIIF